MIATAQPGNEDLLPELPLPLPLLVLLLLLLLPLVELLPPPPLGELPLLPLLPPVLLVVTDFV